MWGVPAGCGRVVLVSRKNVAGKVGSCGKGVMVVCQVGEMTFYTTKNFWR
jgi:hypothetical protein